MALYADTDSDGDSDGDKGTPRALGRVHSKKRISDVNARRLTRASHQTRGVRRRSLW